MNKLLIVLCALAFATTAYAQGTTPAAPATPATPAAPAMKSEAPKTATADAPKTTVKKTTHKKKKAKTPPSNAAPAMSTEKATK